MLPLNRSRVRSRFFPVIAPPPPPPSGWDLSTAAYSGVSFSVAAQETIPNGVAFKADGAKMYVIGQSGDDINEYALSTPWNVSTASFTANTSVAAQTASPQDLYFKSDVLLMYLNTTYLQRGTLRLLIILEILSRFLERNLLEEACFLSQTAQRCLLLDPPTIQFTHTTYPPRGTLQPHRILVIVLVLLRRILYRHRYFLSQTAQKCFFLDSPTIQFTNTVFRLRGM